MKPTVQLTLISWPKARFKFTWALINIFSFTLSAEKMKIKFPQTTFKQQKTSKVTLRTISLTENNSSTTLIHIMSTGIVLYYRFLRFIMAIPWSYKTKPFDFLSPFAINTRLDTSRSTDPVSSLTALDVGVVAVIWIPCIYTETFSLKFYTKKYSVL
jgi:hypothetical protein